ncbi:MAG: hypothetical protein JW871_08485 [Endomicrobiales bacterium]|nr:hypothetical protein [Endomicrobiales bacterium]
MIYRYFSWLLVIAAVLSFYVWQQTQSVRLGYKVDNLRIECEKMKQKNKILRLKVNRLLSLERLDQIAKQKELITPDEKSIIYLSE